MVILSSYRDMSGSSGEREMLWEHELTGECSQTFRSASIKQLDCELKISFMPKSTITYMLYLKIKFNM